ncbi:hypothetical protein [Paenarthrobacter ureafaciens]|uniref:hypothetical protein n=1 Tax=Paenarthrobacter ureafaciens TaxID=37931 RepID=UPI0020C39359|nr:hypothetical protein [Paenarthrobacter ureafaciens]
MTQIQSVEPTTGSPPLPSAMKPEDKAAPAEARSLLATAWLRIRRSRVALVSLCVVVAIVLFALLAPVLTALSGNDPFTSNTSPEVLDDFQTPGLPLPGYMYPSAEHWLGVEPGLGRDLFARLAFGGQVSLTIALCPPQCQSSSARSWVLPPATSGARLTPSSAASWISSLHSRTCCWSCR